MHAPKDNIKTIKIFFYVSVLKNDDNLELKVMLS